jgi:sugar/nucleoside kinase (ribokinase family)
MAIDVFGLGNTLVDIQTFVDDKLLKKLKITKGIMTLIEEKQSMEVLAAIANLKAKSLPGGSCGNSISMAALMGAKTVYTGVVADDMYGRLYEKIISERGVKSMLRFTNTGLTGTAIVLTSADAERTMLTHLGVCGEFTKSDLNMELLSDSAIFHTTG